MIATESRWRGRGAWIGAAALAGLAVANLAPHDAAAHFVLESPESWRVQGVLGDPQKVGPCGNEGPEAMTGAITAYRTGQTITITLREVIFHPGHFRVALAVNDRSELPEPPPVTLGSTDCGSVPIMDPPVFPVLADGVLPHTSALSGEQTIEVTLPAGVTCDRCTLQIVQWMAEHSAPCFYYHCADISISDVVVDAASPDASGAIDSGRGGVLDAGGARPSPSASCACATPGRPERSGALVALALTALAIRHRRRR